MFIYHLHNWQQLGEEKFYDGVCIRFLLEDIIYAEDNNIDYLDLIYGTASRYDLRSKIYPSFMTYRKWIELSKNYPVLILSLNFDVHSWKYKNFCKKILEQFSRNKKIIVAAGNEVYEKRQSAEKVYQTALEVHEAMQETQRIFPIAFWNEAIHTRGSALEKLLNDDRVKKICKYFGFQSLGTPNSRVDKYVKIAKNKGFEGVDTESGTIKSDDFIEAKKKIDLNKSLEIEHTVILTPKISKKLDYDLLRKTALSIGDYKKDKYKLIAYVQQLRTENFITEDDMKLYILKEGVKGNFVRWLQEILEVEYGCLNTGGWDGDFGPITKKQVETFQKENTLPITGVIKRNITASLINKSQRPNYWMKKLQIFMGFE